MIFSLKKGKFVCKKKELQPDTFYVLNVNGFEKQSSKSDFTVARNIYKYLVQKNISKFEYTKERVPS